MSICFGRRTGDTARRFLDIFTPEDILSICKGYGEGDHVANCIYSSSIYPNNLIELTGRLAPITFENIANIIGDEFMVAYRPINPLTEGTNRGKNVYTRFQPYKRLEKPTFISNAKELFALGKFVQVEPNCLDHNHILNDLQDNYNIIVPRKGK